MPEQNDLLEEFKHPYTQNNKEYLAFLYISAFYIIVVFIIYIFKLNNLSFSHEASDWIFMTIFVLPALSGFLTSIGGSYVGWSISLLYYTTIIGFAVPLVVKDLYKGWVPIYYFFTEGYRILPLVLLPPVIILLLLSKRLRIQMEVSVRLFRIVLIISLASCIGLGIASVYA